MTPVVPLLLLEISPQSVGILKNGMYSCPLIYDIPYENVQETYK